MPRKRIRLDLEQKKEILARNDSSKLSQVELGEWVKQHFNLDKPLSQQTISNILAASERIHNADALKKKKKNLKKAPACPQQETKQNEQKGMEPPGLTTDDENKKDEEEQEPVIDIENETKRYRKAIEDLLLLDFPLDDFDRLMHRRLREKLIEARAEEYNSRKQTSIKSFFKKQ